MSVRIIVGDVRETLAQIPDASVQCCVTSPPYFGLRDYGHAGQIGLEPTPDAYVAEMVAVFREVRRVLRDDGTLWLNLGDSYAADRGYQVAQMKGGPKHGPAMGVNGRSQRASDYGCKPKDLLGIPWRVAFALQADGWYLRADIVWHKPNPMPENVTDRPTKAHEYVFLLTKSARYYYDAGAIAEPVARVWDERNGPVGRNGLSVEHGGQRNPQTGAGLTERNARSVWSIEATGNRERECIAILSSDLSIPDKWEAIKTMMSGAQSDVWRVATQPFKGAHFATMPPGLAERCIKAGTKPSDTVLDPFGGAGTTGLVADRLGRDAVLCELNPAYAALARDRIKGDNPMFTDVA